MDYVIRGLPLPLFQPYFDMDDASLRAHGIVRTVADAAHAFPCRVTLEDAAPGDSLLLLPWMHLDADTPYRASGPVFVNESARSAASVHNRVPEQQRRRLLSVRAYDADGWMQDAEVGEGTQLEALIARFFNDPRIAFLHVHNARRGCYACRVDRA